VRRPGSSSRATDEARKSIHSKFEVPVPTVCLAGTAGVRKTEIEGTVRQARLADGRVLSSHAACTVSSSKRNVVTGKVGSDSKQVRQLRGPFRRSAAITGTVSPLGGLDGSLIG
jgi:hypothetical protein